jgi:hypothetical protein
MSTIFEHHPHPYIEERKIQGPVKVQDQRRTDTAWHRVNAKVGLTITLLVGTMLCGYIFAAIALISLPSAIKSHNLTIIVAWVSSNFLQLVLLPIIIVGQNIQARAADKRSEATYNDAAAVLHEALQIQKHLEAQDQAIEQILASVTGSPAAGSTAPGTPIDRPAAPPSAP